MDREEIDNLLCTLLGSEYVYFQPPATITMNYPCIIYKKSRENIKFANGSKYFKKNGYQITIVDANPDSLIPEKVSNLPYSRFDTTFTKDNLHHSIYTVYI